MTGRSARNRVNCRSRWGHESSVTSQTRKLKWAEVWLIKTMLSIHHLARGALLDGEFRLVWPFQQRKSSKQIDFINIFWGSRDTCAHSRKPIHTGYSALTSHTCLAIIISSAEIRRESFSRLFFLPARDFFFLLLPFPPVKRIKITSNAESRTRVHFCVARFRNVFHMKRNTQIIFQSLFIRWEEKSCAATADKTRIGLGSRLSFFKLFFFVVLWNIFFVHNFFRGSLVCLTKEKKNISSSTRLPSILINKRPELVVEPGRQFGEEKFLQTEMCITWCSRRNRYTTRRASALAQFSL